MALVLLGVLIVLIRPWHLRLSVKGRGEFGKFWVIALGAELGYVTATFADAHGIDSVFQVHVFGRRVFHASPAMQKVADVIEDEIPDLDKKMPRLRKRVERWFDLGDLLRYVVIDLRRQIRMDRLNGRLVYSTPDVALTGILSGQLYTIAGLLSPFGSLVVEPQWVDVAKIEGNISLAFRFSPAGVLLNALVFTFKKIKLRQRQADAAPAETKTMGGRHAQ
jgi:hypothetical protein